MSTVTSSLVPTPGKFESNVLIFKQKKYSFKNQLGSEGDDVWCVSDGKKDFAIKRFPLFDKQKPTLASVQNEFAIMRKLNHPNIVKARAFVETDQNYFLIMDKIEGKPLDAKQLLKHGSKHVLDQARGLIQYIHSCRVAHLDLHGGNFLITKEGRLVLIDFGCARYFPNSWAFMFRTPGGLAKQPPEAIDLHNHPQKAPPYIAFDADAWGFGIAIYRLLCGSHPLYTVEEYEAAYEACIEPNKKIREFKARNKAALHGMQEFQKGLRSIVLPKSLNAGERDFLRYTLRLNKPTFTDFPELSLFK